MAEELDLSKATAEDIDALFEERIEAGELEMYNEGDVEVAPEPDPEPVEEPVEEVEAAPQEETVEDAPVEETPDKEADADPLESLDERDLQLQEMRLEMERLQQERQKFEHLAGRHGGEVGFLKKELERLREAPPQPQDDFERELVEARQAQPQPRTPSHLEDEVAELRKSAMESAVERTYSDFLSRINEDLMAQGVEQGKLATEQEAIIGEITPTLKDRFEPYGDLSRLGAKSIQKVTRMVLEGAYTDHKLAKVAQLRRELSERKASQIERSKIVKQAAEPSGSGTKSVQEPPPKKVEEMTAEEADAALIALEGDGRGRIRLRR